MGVEDRLNRKQQRLTALKVSYQELEKKFQMLAHELQTETPEKINLKHIADLKLYNELRDTGLRLVQMVADEKQCKMKDVFEEIGYQMKD
ncbi:Sae3 [Kluyveromyces lactis]|nr:Sae3 [Kluyveromyces lactis]